VGPRYEPQVEEEEEPASIAPVEASTEGAVAESSTGDTGEVASSGDMLASSSVSFGGVGAEPLGGGVEGEDGALASSPLLEGALVVAAGGAVTASSEPYVEPAAQAQPIRGSRGRKMAAQVRR
jgi:hypothetical protein